MVRLPWPLAFAQTQKYWSFLAPQDRGWSTKIWSLATLEPIWGMYVPDYPRYWRSWDYIGPASNPLFNFMFWNPILFLLAVALLALGSWRRWLITALDARVYDAEHELFALMLSNTTP